MIEKQDDDMPMNLMKKLPLTLQYTDGLPDFLNAATLTKRKAGSGRHVTASGDDTFQAISERIEAEPTVSTRMGSSTRKGVQEYPQKQC